MLEAYISLYVFIIFVAGTPGPANLLAMLAGSQKGFKPCIGFIIGLVAGKIPLDILVGLGIGIILIEYSTIYTLFKYISAGYMIYLAVITWNKKYVNSNSTKNYSKKIIKPTTEELKLHKDFLKNSLKKNYF